MNYTTGKIVGINTDQRASLSISAPGEDDNLFLGLLQLECDDAFTRGRQLLSDVADEFFEDSEGHVQKLTKAGESVSLKLQNTNNLNFLMAGFSGKALYLISKGEVLAYLYRQGSTSPLTLNPGQVISGFLEPGDRVLLATKGLSNLLGDDLGRSLGLPRIQLEEEVTQKLAESEDPAQSGLILDIEALENESVRGIGEVSDSNNDVPLPKISLGIFKSIPNLLPKLRKIFPRSGRGKLILALILILVLGLGVGYQFKTKADAEKNAKFTGLFSSAKGDFDAAKGLASLDPPAAKAKLTQAKDELIKALAIKSDPEALDLKKQIEAEEGSILQQFSVSKLPVFLDLSLIKDGFQSTQMSLSTGKLVLLDTNSKTLVAIDMVKKSNQILAGKDTLGEAQSASINGDSVFVYSSDKGILKVGLSDKKVVVVSKKDDDWGKITDLAGFAGNVYVLDSLKNQIWKYLVTANGFGDKKNYLNDGVKADFAGALRMQIESSVYVLKQGGEILRFTRGASDNFSIGGLDKGIKDPKSIFVSSDTDNFYVLDSGNSRLVVLTKTGAYKQQYQAPEFGTANDLVVDEKSKQVYLLLDGKIYSSDLK